MKISLSRTKAIDLVFVFVEGHDYFCLCGVWCVIRLWCVVSDFAVIGHRSFGIIGPRNHGSRCALCAATKAATVYLAIII